MWSVEIYQFRCQAAAPSGKSWATQITLIVSFLHIYVTALPPAWKSYWSDRPCSPADTIFPVTSNNLNSQSKGAKEIHPHFTMSLAFRSKDGILPPVLLSKIGESVSLRALEQWFMVIQLIGLISFLLPNRFIPPLGCRNHRTMHDLQIQLRPPCYWSAVPPCPTFWPKNESSSVPHNFFDFLRRGYYVNLLNFGHLGPIMTFYRCPPTEFRTCDKYYFYLLSFPSFY